MGNPATFWPEALQYARQVHAATGVLTSVLLAQTAIETGYGGPDWSVSKNPANVGSFDGQPVNSFASLQAGTNAWIQTLELGYYNAVRSAVGYVNQSVALGNSPWASAHYRLPGGANGSELIYVIEHYNLTQYDGAAPQPTPVPVPPAPTYSQESNMLTKDPKSGGYWGVRPNGNVYTFDGAPYIGPLAKYTAQWGIGTPQNPIVGIAADGVGGFALLADNGGAQPNIYNIPASGQYAS